MDKIVHENKWRQTQFNENMGKYGKSKLKNIVKYNLLGLLVFHMTKIRKCLNWPIYGHRWILSKQQNTENE
jgi:hypothetical protein